MGLALLPGRTPLRKGSAQALTRSLILRCRAAARRRVVLPPVVVIAVHPSVACCSAAGAAERGAAVSCSCCRRCPAVASILSLGGRARRAGPWRGGGRARGAATGGVGGRARGAAEWSRGRARGADAWSRWLGSYGERGHTTLPRKQKLLCSAQGSAQGIRHDHEQKCEHPSAHRAAPDMPQHACARSDPAPALVLLRPDHSNQRGRRTVHKPRR